MTRVAKKYFWNFGLMRFVQVILILLAALLVYLSVNRIYDLYWASSTVRIGLDQEHLLDGVPLNASTQSVNRYHSNLRRLDTATVDFDKKSKRLTFSLFPRSESNDGLGAGEKVVMSDIDARFVVPLLPYNHDEEYLDEFSAFNLMLAEYSRMGVGLSRQQFNPLFGYFSYDGVFEESSGEYLYRDGTISANPGVLPKRMHIVNNCLTPGLWEINASDSVGEMYHGWIDIPDSIYLSILRETNNLFRSSNAFLSSIELRNALRYKKNVEVELDLDVLRDSKDVLFSADAKLAHDKTIGGYSSQDSRRKVQRGFYKIKRGGEFVHAAKLGELMPGDVFQLRAFVEPGVYSPEKSQLVEYDPDWNHVEVREVEPLTYYEGNQSQYDDFGYIELTLYSRDKEKALIVGNVPVSLLVFQEDFDIPALGVGVWSSSEPIERRYLRMKEGPSPAYAYLAKHREGKFFGVNNHEYGVEQVYLRPFKRGDDVYLRVTVVSYERIMDIMELEVAVEKQLSDRIVEASDGYKRPLFRTYSDSNIL